jgi:hypothetical protein
MLRVVATATPGRRAPAGRSAPSISEILHPAYMRRSRINAARCATTIQRGPPSATAPPERTLKSSVRNDRHHDRGRSWPRRHCPMAADPERYVIYPDGMPLRRLTTVARPLISNAVCADAVRAAPRACRSPRSWDHSDPVLATVMGPPELPVVGPPSARLPGWSRPAVCDHSRSIDLEVAGGVPGGSCARGTRGSTALGR